MVVCLSMCLYVLKLGAFLEIEAQEHRKNGAMRIARDFTPPNLLRRVFTRIT